MVACTATSLPPAETGPPIASRSAAPSVAVVATTSPAPTRAAPTRPPDPLVSDRQVYSPIGSGTTYVFDQTATTEYQTLIKGAVDTSQRFWGVGAPITLYASADADSVWESYVKFIGSTDPPSKLRASYPAQAQSCPPASLGPVMGGAQAVAFGIFLCLVPSVYPTQIIAKVTAHEYFHAIQAYLSRSVITSSQGRTPYLGPVWLIEGSARWSELKIGFESDAFSQQLATAVRYARQAPSSLQCSETGSAYFSTSADPYLLGTAAVDLLIATKGQQALLAYWSQFAAGTYWPTAFESAFAMRIDNFYEDYDRMRSQPGRSTSC